MMPNGYDSLTQGLRESLVIVLHMPELPQLASLHFGHALAELVAAKLGIRIIHFKGIAAEIQLPVASTTSTDVDILIEPGRAKELIDALIALPQAELVLDDGVPVHAATHAVTIFMKLVNVSIDAHFWFPGFNQDPAELFEELWQDTDQIELGGWQVRVPNRIWTVLLGLAHAARNPDKGHTHAAAVDRWQTLSPVEQPALIKLAAQHQAEKSIGSVLTPPVHRFDMEDFFWRAQQRPLTILQRRLLTFVATRGLGGKLQLVRRALRPKILDLPGNPQLPEQDANYFKSSSLYREAPAAITGLWKMWRDIYGK